ncbi:MAG: peptidyl-prolyl cis-trans isomerase C, partial [Candidatus Krumholzibacteriia bacterium]
MSPSETTPESNRPVRATSSAGNRFSLILRSIVVVMLAIGALATVGCGGGEKAAEDVLLAKVGTTEVMGSYYEGRLVLIEENELPRDEDGRVMDTSEQAGKMKFLENLINKEVMVQTAASMGYGSDPQIDGARQSLLAYEAGLALWSGEIAEPNNAISEEQLQAFYSRMGSSRQCRYVITNFKEQAEEARAMALTGADWQDVVDTFHDGDVDPEGKYEISVPYGRYNAPFENGVFNSEIGAVTAPITTIYGFWVLKIDGEKAGKRPPLEEAKAKILDITRGRMISHTREEFKKELREKYAFVLHEDALWKAFQGMPKKEDIFYPGTKDAVKQEDLEPLNVSTEDRELAFYGYTKGDGTERLFTLGDYKSKFDNMSVFQRPKAAQMLGGLRAKIIEDVEKIFVDLAARDLGYYEDAGVLLKVNKKVEEMTVNRLFNDIVRDETRITAEELNAFWEEHMTDYYQPETRSGRLVICVNEASAKDAKADLTSGASWRDVLVKFGTSQENKSRSGKIEGVRADVSGAVGVAMFQLDIGGVSEPFVLEEGTYGLVMLEGATEPYQPELASLAEDLGKR